LSDQIPGPFRRTQHLLQANLNELSLGMSSRAISVWTMMGVRMLLKSWAIPPARTLWPHLLSLHQPRLQLLPLLLGLLAVGDVLHHATERTILPAVSRTWKHSHAHTEPPRALADHPVLDLIVILPSRRSRNMRVHGGAILRVDGIKKRLIGGLEFCGSSPKIR